MFESIIETDVPQEVVVKILSVFDKEFSDYGKVLDGYDVSALIDAAAKIPMPDSGTAYRAALDELESCHVVDEFSARAYGGMPIQAGLCWGHNTRLNCLEYHKDSELNIGEGDFVLLVAKEGEIVDGRISSSCVKAFRVPKRTVVEVYATTLHYAPCHTDGSKGFRVVIVLPKGTNTAMPDVGDARNGEEKLLWARNKWLIAHKDTSEAASGAYVGIDGENIDIEALL